MRRALGRCQRRLNAVDLRLRCQPRTSDAVGIDARVGIRRLQLTARPDARPRSGPSVSRNRVCAHRRDRQTTCRGRAAPRSAAHGSSPMTCASDRPASTRLARDSPSWCFTGRTVRRAAQRQDVDRVVLFDDGDNRDARRHLARGQRDVGVDGVLAVGDDQSRADGARPLVGGARCRSRRRSPTCRRRPAAPPPPDPVRPPSTGCPRSRNRSIEAGGDRVVFGDDDVPAESVGHLARRAQPHPRFEPRGVEQADEQEWQHDEQEHDARTPARRC